MRKDDLIRMADERYGKGQGRFVYFSDLKNFRFRWFTYNYELSNLTQAREEEGVVESVSRTLGSLVERLYTKTEMITAGCSLLRCICTLCDFRVTSTLLLNSHTESYHEVCHECDKNYL